VGSMQMAGLGECSRRSLLQLVRANEYEAEEQGEALLLKTSEQCSEQHAQLSENPPAVAAAVAVGLPSVRLSQLAQNGAGLVCNLYPRWVCQERRVSQLTGCLHVRSAATSLRKREVLDAGG